MPTANYLLVIGCKHDAANRNDSYRKDHRSDKQKLMNVYLYTNQIQKPTKMTNSTSTDVISENTWCNRMIAKKKSCHSIAPADKHINEKNITVNQPSLFKYYMVYR